MMQSHSQLTSENLIIRSHTEDYLTTAYKVRLPIAIEKYQSLKNLCTKGVTPSTYHNEYLTLPRPTVKHCLMETDEEDDVRTFLYFTELHIHKSYF